MFVGCLTWNAIWCGEKVTLLLFVTFNSTVKKPRFSAYPTRSGKPKDAQDSTRVHVIFGVFFLTFCQSFDSGFKVIYCTKIAQRYFSLDPTILFSTSVISLMLNSFCMGLRPSGSTSITFALDPTSDVANLVSTVNRFLTS